MTFSVKSYDLTRAIEGAVEKIALEVFQGPRPHELYHYTSAQVVASVVRNRCLWATCIADQRDQSEISFASNFVGEFAQSTTQYLADFPADVLNRIPRFMDERKQWIFIACFCDDNDSEKHWEDYGRYCMSFPSPWSGHAALYLDDLHADCWYQRVIYDEYVQQDALRRSLLSIAEAVKRHTTGVNAGPWREAMIDGCARTAAQLLLRTAAGFKRSEYRLEREWRIVCSPRLGSNNSAPQSLDEEFRFRNIKVDCRRHLELSVRAISPLFQSALRPPVPFTACRRYHKHLVPTELELISETLRSNYRPDLICS